MNNYVKKINEKGEELNMNLSHKSEELRKCEESLQEEERKASELREFLKGLMKQKEEMTDPDPEDDGDEDELTEDGRPKLSLRSKPPAVM